MSQKKIEHVNIYLKNNTDKENIFRDSSTYEKYIILMNEDLQGENKNLTKQISDLNVKLNEKEEENDKYDTSKRYIKGLLHNLIEIEKMTTEINENINEFYKKEKNIYENNFISTKFYFQLYESFFIIFLGILFQLSFMNIFLIIIFIFYISGNFYFIEKFPDKINICNSQENNNLTEKIQKIKKSQDFLSEYIDNI